ncbi:MAG: hypothetical protein OEY80_04760 [Nitrospirota bacterium]|nr:hypothetical protein [Nitrospirota bacterium]MDH4361277.1 hypothetical protein [Nitrospirota bacterium]MDH5574772.1 hypothetical protein [Nitrospirota bacterium]
MKQILQHPTTRLWCLVGLTGMALSAAIFLGEGQARTLTTPPPIESVRAQDTYSTRTLSKSSLLEKNQISPTTKPSHHPEAVTQEMNNEEQPKKKRLGLAILFLGMLAEKS